jgi:HSP20 family protein
MDISETPDALDISMDVPGMTDKDVEITLADDVLTIKGERKSEIEENKADYHRVERSFGSFLRRFELPSEVEDAKVTATVTQGVLKVHLPKNKDAKARETKIAIKSA